MRLVFLLLSLLASLPGQDLLTSGRQAMERGQYAEAERLFREQIKLSPRSAEALSNLGAVLSRQDKLPDAIAAYREALVADSKLTAIYLNIGIAYFRAGEYEAALQPLDQFLKAEPADFRARQLHAISLVEAGHYPNGIAELDKLSQEKPNTPAILFALASAHIRAGDEDRGKQLLQQLETLNLPPASVHLLEGMLFYRSKLYPEAERELRAGLELDAHSAPTLAALGRLRLRVNDDPAAIDLFKRALAIQPQDAESNYQLGVLLGRNGDPEGGRKYLTRALEQRANYPDPMYFLAKMELTRNRPEAAIQYLEQASRLAPHQENITFLLANAYKQAGQEQRAKQEFAEFRSLQSERLKRDRTAVDPAQAPDPTEPVVSAQQP